MKTIVSIFVKCLLLTILVMVSFMQTMAQNDVVRSQTIEEYNGKSYFLHRVAAQQTLYSIAKAYGITVEGLLIENPDARSGLRTNQVLRIPASKAAAGQELPEKKPQPAQQQNDDYDYLYHVAGKNETYKYLSEVYLIRENLIRTANPGIKEPFTEGDYVLVPITKKEKNTTSPESRYKRSTYDPYLQPPPKSPASPDPRLLTTNTKVETISPFDAPLNPGTPQRQNNKQTEKPVEPKENLSVSTSNIHIVKPKETLFSIAAQYGISQEKLLATNPGISQNLRAGQVLKLPLEEPVAAIEPGSDPDSATIHTVAKGETLYKISRQYGISPDELTKYNQGLTQSLSVGQKIKIPKKKTNEAFLIHRVDERQKSKNLAKEYGISEKELNKANPSIGNEVFPNQKVRIPLDRKQGTLPLQPEISKNQQEKTMQETALKPETVEAAEDCDPNPDGKTIHIALMLPLYLEKVEALKNNSGNNDESRLLPLRFLSFYKGFMMAADSLAKTTDIKVQIKVYDVDQSIAKAEKALQDQWLEHVDLIIGPFHSQSFDKIANFARERGIMIVNPVSPRKEILDQNSYVVKIKPDPSVQFDQLAAFIAQRYPDAKIFIYHARSNRFANEANTLKAALEKKLPSEVSIRNGDLARKLRRSSDLNFQTNTEGKWIDMSELQFNEDGNTRFPNTISLLSYDRDSLRFFKKNATIARDNIVIALGDDRVFAMEFLNKLNQNADNLAVKFIGLPNWTEFDNLFNEILLRLDAHFMTEGNINWDFPEVKNFIMQYRQSYQTEPDHYAFEGFDIGWYFMEYKRQYGSAAMNCIEKKPMKLLHTHFHFRQNSEDSGYENTYWDIIKYENYSIIPLRNSYFYP